MWLNTPYFDHVATQSFWCLLEGMESWLAEVKENREVPAELVREAEGNLVVATDAIAASSDDTRLTTTAQ